MEHLLLLIAASILGYAVVSALVPRTVLTAPIVFVCIGVILAATHTGIQRDAAELLEVVAELTLVILLFTDATRINARRLFKQFGLPLRLLSIGLPLTIVAGIVLGCLLLPEFSWWEIALLAAILAPTDAALGQAVVSSKNVPSRIRQSLNVESGLNDGIVVPFVMLFAALAATHSESEASTPWLQFVAKQVVFGPLAGIATGCIGGWAIEKAADRGWVAPSFQKLSAVGLAVFAWAGAIAIGGNGFIAAFVCGLSLGASTICVKPAIQEFGEIEGQLFSLVSFLLFGAFFVLPTLRDATPVHWLYAGGSLTVVRMLPVALSMIGAKMHFSTSVFIGWFGPRGLASLIFALLVTREHTFLHGNEIFTIAMLTATLSIVAHGLTAVPGSNWYARIINADDCRDGCEHEESEVFPLRHPRIVRAATTSDVSKSN